MATVYDHSCLMTTLRNDSGGTKTFSFLPPHGQELTAGEEINIVGDVISAINRGDRFGSRFNEAYLNALDAGDLAVVSTPQQVVYDETLGVSRTLGVDDGSLSLSAVCWLTSLSEA